MGIFLVVVLFRRACCFPSNSGSRGTWHWEAAQGAALLTWSEPEPAMLLAPHGAEMGNKFHLLISPSNHSSCCHSPHVYRHKLMEVLPVSGSMRMTLPPSIQATQSFPSASMHIPSGICSSFSRWYKSLGQAAGRVTKLMLCGLLPILYQIPL